jgi:Putative MetA-pathway of phenol degradation
MRQIQWLCLTIFVFCCLAAPALAGPPYDVADPETPERHRIELNVGYLSSHARGSETQEFPGFDFNYGYLNNLQLTLGVTCISTRNGGSGRTAGLGDVLPEIKWRFLQETKHRPQFALDYTIKLPTASRSRGLGTGGADHALIFTGQKAFERFTLFGNIGYNILGDRSGRDNVLYGLVLTYQVTERLSAGAEVYGNTSAATGERAELAWGLGLTYNFAPDRALMLKAAHSVQGLSDLNVYAGVQFNFGKK